MDSPDEKRQPRIEIRDEKNKVLKSYQMPVRANLLVADYDEWKKKRGAAAGLTKPQEEKEHVRVAPGDIIAKIPRETTKTKDITGGLPRVVELFEARKPRETAVMTEIDGTVKFGPITKGLRRVIVEAPDGEKREYSIPRGVHINVQEGDLVKAGEPLMDGPLNPHDILAVRGIEELQRYLVNEIQEVYRLQGVNINDKHIEVIVRQMLRWVRIKEVGDTEFLLEDMVDRFRFQDENERVMAEGGQAAQAEPLLLGITKASLSTESFISAASFQETTRVLTEAAISGKVDYLRGLKENVIMGRLIPAGTGMEFYRNIKLEPDKTEEREDYDYDEAEIPAGEDFRVEAKEVGD
jgi:DNA-directed RNA polymerase subunit beta'